MALLWPGVRVAPMAPSLAATEALRDAQEHVVGNAAAARAARLLVLRLQAMAPDPVVAGAALAAMILTRHVPHP